ncbi:hypothetical protein Rt10032_c02g0854 [Rhodotorula toruloides]|uniref:Uncharacterized protein n=1 Tax=Rhodotorula toruloides TaxID=5286 RepID=A0A511K914_RHOTO|nr:hypothetical protein Rt10032_c02g0854 [Rhodotorula toruloides]
MSIMPQPVIVHDSVHLFSCIQQCFQDILRKAVYSGDGATQGTVEGVLHILDSSLRLVWHQLGLVDVEGGGRWTFQQEICGEVLYWQRGNNPLDRTEIDTVFAQIKELIRRGGEAYDEHKLNLGGIAQTASLQQRRTRAQLGRAHAHLQQSLDFPGHGSSGESLEGPRRLDSPFSPQPVQASRHSTPSTSSYLSSTAASSLSPSPSRSPSRSSHSPQVVNPSDLVLHEPRSVAPQVHHRSPRPLSAHNSHSPPPHEPYTGWQGDHDPIGHQSFFDEAFGFDPDTSPHGPSPSYDLAQVIVSGGPQREFTWAQRN